MVVIITLTHVGVCVHRHCVRQFASLSELEFDK